MALEGPEPDVDPDDGVLDLKAVLREVLIAGIIVGVVFGGIFAYTQVYPPLVVVESSSMQHAQDTSYVGVIDTGDLVLVQAARIRPDVVTWVEGRVSGHATYGDYGDVIVFRKPTAPADATPVIHRAILYIVPNGTDAYDVPDLRNFPSLQWEGISRNGSDVQDEPVALRQVTIHQMGWRHDLGITFDLAALAANPVNRVAGFITMGDNNAYDACNASPDPCEPFKPYDQAWVVPMDHVIGRSRGEIPWFGLLKLTYQPTLVRIMGAIAGVVLGVLIPRTNRNVILIAAALTGAIAGYFIAGIFDTTSSPTGACCLYWGQVGRSGAPQNSWDSLLIALPLLFASPVLFEGGLWAWHRYVTPRIRRWRGRPEGPAPDPPEPR
jgi:signal peptidase